MTSRSTAQTAKTAPSDTESDTPSTTPPVSTASRSLAIPGETGEVRRLNGTAIPGRFGLVEEVSGHHHDAVCSACGLVIDATSSARCEVALAETAPAIAEANGIDVADHRLELVGRCSSCARATG